MSWIVKRYFLNLCRPDKLAGIFQTYSIHVEPLRSLNERSG